MKFASMQQEQNMEIKIRSLLGVINAKVNNDKKNPKQTISNLQGFHKQTLRNFGNSIESIIAL